MPDRDSRMDTAMPGGTDPRYAWLGLDARPEGIPMALQRIAQWVLWRAQPKATGTGITKVPYQPNGLKASSNDPSTWCDFAFVLSAYQESLETDQPYSGIGFVLTEHDAILAFDFDHVRNPHTGEIDPEVLKAVRWIGTYAEISPSGTGIRVLGRGDLGSAISTAHLQAWDSGRYITITGHRLDGVPDDICDVPADRVAAVRAFWESTERRRDPSAVVVERAIDVRTQLELSQALRFISADDYEIWIGMGHALRELGTIGRGLWLTWSQGSAKYDAKTAARKWAGFEPRSTGYQAVFALAQKHGWVNPQSKEALAFEVATGMTFEEANHRVPESEVVEECAPLVRPFPVPELNDLAAWIERAAAVAYPVVTQQAVLCLVGVAASRLYVTPQGDPLSLYLGASARSVGELRYAYHAVGQIMAAAGLRRMVRGTRLTSPQAVYKTLLRSPAALYLSDDYGGVSAFSRRQPSGSQEHALSLLASVYDGKSIQLDGPEDAGFRPGTGQVNDEQPVIHAPCLSLLALVGTDHLATLMRQSETGRGALQQLLLAIGDERSVIERDPEDIPAPAWICDKLRGIRRVARPGGAADLTLADLFSNIAADMHPQQTVVPFLSPLEPVYAALDAVSADRGVRSLLLAARAQVRRVAAGLAVWANPDRPAVTAEILHWSGAYVRDRVSDVVDRFATLNTDDGKPSIYEQVLTKILDCRSSGLARRDVHKYCRAFRSLSADKRADLLQQMLDDETLFELDLYNQKTKRTSKRLVAEKYVKRGTV